MSLKPQIVTQEFGRFNGDLEASSAQMVKGGSWKRQRVIMIIPAADMIPAKVYLSHCCIVFPPNNGAHRMLCVGQEVGQAYSNAIDQILAHPDLSQWEFVCSLEHDNIVPCDGLVKLIRRLEEHQELSAVSGLYYCKGPEGWNAPHVWGDIRDPICNFRPQPPVPGALVECCGLSMGFTLYRLSMFKDARIERPFFETKAGKEGVGTQDLSFWGKARKLGYRCGVDCGCLVGHYDSENDICW
jgi:hypothetical protein